MGWLAQLGPQLWRFRQYEPRPIALPSRYSSERAPESNLKIAIVTPSFNQGQFLRATVESVISQNFPNLSYRVEDGGSRDNTMSVLESYGDRLVWRSEPDEGQASAINRGFTEIQGDVMGFLNSDDLLLPGCLGYVARFFSENPEIDFVYGHRIYIDENGMEIGRWVTVPHDTMAQKWVNIIPQETMFWRRRVWDSIGPFDEKLQFALDWDFILRADAAGFKFRRLPRFLGCFRVHTQQKTSTRLDVNEREAAQLKTRYLGFNPDGARTTRALWSFYGRQMMLQRMYNAKVLRY